MSTEIGQAPLFLAPKVKVDLKKTNSRNHIKYYIKGHTEGCVTHFLYYNTMSHNLTLIHSCNVKLRVS